MQRVIFYLVLAVLTPAYGQDMASKIASGLSSYGEKVLQEKVFVHTDRSFYMAGETIWFKVYATDGVDHRPLDLNKVAYVEMLDRDQQPVLQTKVSLQKGSGDGSLVLPVDMNSGQYQFRVYTRWMRNFEPAFYFTKVISVLNSFKPLAKSFNLTTASYDVQFFPEGGNLVNGIKSKVAFRAVGRSGVGLHFKGYVVNDGGDTVVQFQPLKFGIGHFYFTPVQGNKYTAVLTDSLNRPFAKTELPNASPYGYVMHLSEENDRLQVSVQAAHSSYEAPTVYLLAHTRGSIKVKDSRLLQGSTALFSIDKKLLGDGISHITIFNQNNEPLCERLYFKRPGNELIIQGGISQPAYTSRRKVTVELSVKQEATAGREMDLSMSVYRLDSLQGNDELSVESYLLLTSDLQGTIESPSYYFSNDVNVKEAMDNLMLTHGWRRFRWEHILTGQVPDVNYIPEYRGQIIQGRVTDASAGKPAAGVTTYMSIPGKQYHFRGSQSSMNGDILFEVRDFYGQGKIIVQTNFEKDSLYTIEIASPYSTQYAPVTLPSLKLSKDLEKQVLTRSVNMQLQKSFFERNTASHVVDSIPFYGTPDERYFLDAYTRFPVMEEVMREYVRPVTVRKRKDNFHFLVYDKPNDLLFRDDPLVLLDGVPVFDTDKIMQYDPLNVQRLDVVTKRYFYGPLTFSGIVAYVTYSGDLSGFEIDDRARVISYDGVQLKKEFFAPVYETEEQLVGRSADFRDLLFWKPYMKFDERGTSHVEFFTSDQPGKYLIVVHGLSSDGKADTWMSEFEVLPSENN